MAAERKSTVGILGCGEMGAAIGACLRAAGHEVLTVTGGRSEETRQRAAEADLTPVADLEALVAGADVLFSVLPASQAEEAGGRLAAIAESTGAGFTFVEANAISPQMLSRIAGGFAGTAVRFVDGGIVGAPPGGDGVPRLFVSGAQCGLVGAMDGIAFDLVALGPEPGAASGFKMAYAAITKGTNALLATSLLLAEEMGFLDAYLAEIGASQPALSKRAEASVPRLPADAARWVSEMEEIRDTFAGHGLPGGFHQAASELMALLAGSRFGAETRRTRDASRGMRQTIVAVAEDRKAARER